MKVTLYVILTERGSRAAWSIAPEIDLAFWLDAGYREAVQREVARYDAAAGILTDKPGWGLSERVVELVFWQQPIALGLAVMIAERWPAAARPMDREEARENLARLVALAYGAEKRAGTLMEPLPLAHAGHAPGASGGAADRAGAQALAAQACRAAALLQGRALLGSEALALLAAADAAAVPAAGAAPPPWSAAAPALQLAALLGRLRLGGALAPQPQPRLLRWRAALRGGAEPRPLLRCQRCGSGPARMRHTPCAACGRTCAYCEACLAMGRSRECGLLILGTPAVTTGNAPALRRHAAADQPQQPAGIEARLEPWGLSPAQSAATAAALRYLEAQNEGNGQESWLRRMTGTGKSATANNPRRFLLWAVTGAGKTEMIFPLVDACLRRGGRALIATPRRDVVLELDPRLRRAFPNAAVVTLYGGSGQRWEDGELMIATTHQLFRFRHGFDLVIIDEMDAFPYHNDPMLHYAANNVCKPGGVTMLLSATPPVEFRRAVRFGRLPHVRVPVRFHRHPLPVPQQIRMPPVRQLLRRRALPRQLLAALKSTLERGAQAFVFVGQIRDVQPLVQKLRVSFAGIAIDGTSSKDPERAEKVLHFRNRIIRLLVTTTILERGVTVPKSDVFILDADGKLFDESSLVQMAGRAGRSKDDPAGRVYFFASFRSRSQQSAIRQIRGMNRIAKRSGFLSSQGKGV